MNTRLTAISRVPFVATILFYRKVLSPLKGYTCGYSSGGFGSSCSTYGLKVFQRFAPLMAYRLLNRQFKRCSSLNSLYKQKGEINPLCIPFVCCGEKWNDIQMEKHHNRNSSSSGGDSAGGVIVVALCLAGLIVYFGNQGGKEKNISAGQPSASSRLPTPLAPSAPAVSPTTKTVLPQVENNTRTTDAPPALRSSVSEGNTPFRWESPTERPKKEHSAQQLTITKLPPECNPEDVPIREMRKAGEDFIEGIAYATFGQNSELMSVEVNGLRTGILTRATERIFTQALGSSRCRDALGGGSGQVHVPFVFRVE